MSKVETMDLKGKEYAGVPVRIKEFREANPSGKIITQYNKAETGTIFKSYIWKDKKDVQYYEGSVILDSADATGTAESTKRGEKDFEKLETVSIGRGLAILGYLASGQVASSEEMEQFNEYKQDRIDDAVATINNTETLEQLKEVFMGLGKLMAEKDVVDAKNTRKAELS